MAETVRTTLACPQCAVTGPHELRYQRGALVSVRCLECGRALQLSAAERGRSWVRGLSRRVATKPGRVLQEARREPVRFALGLPRRIASKPARLAYEVTGAVLNEALTRLDARGKLSNRSGW